MAERRMFTKKITDDDNFMQLSASAQALYLHLSMAADDDGFCNQVSACMFKSHASVQDLEALLSKRYVYQFDNGVIVIKHWRMANALRKDRYTPTAFQEELAQLRIKENGSYTRLSEDGCRLVADWLPSGCHSIGKDSIGKVSIEEEKDARAMAQVMDYFMDHINAVPSPFAVAQLKTFTEELGPEVVIHACAIAQDEGKRSWNYIQAILNRYKRDGLDSMEKVEQDEQLRRDVQEAKQGKSKNVTAAEYEANRKRNEKPIGEDEFAELKKFAESFG